MTHSPSETREMTKRQSWAIYTIYGYDVRDSSLTYEEAYDLVGAAKVEFEGWDKDELIKIIDEAGGVKKREGKPKVNWESLFGHADQAGYEAANKHKPTPMTVVERANPLDDSSEIVKQYEPIADGVCGFASIVIRPGNHPFVNWIKKNDALVKKANLYGGKHYYGGYSLSVMGFNQSYEKKSEYARAFCDTVRNAVDDDKLELYVDKRLD
jgi:hypothetical protein